MRELSLVVASGGHSSSRCVGLPLSRPLLLRSTGSRRAGSVTVAHGPRCSAACGIFPDQGSNPCPLHWQADSQPLRHQGSPLKQFYITLQAAWSQTTCRRWLVTANPSGWYRQHPRTIGQNSIQPPWIQILHCRDEETDFPRHWRIPSGLPSYLAAELGQNREVWLPVRVLNSAEVHSLIKWNNALNQKRPFCSGSVRTSNIDKVAFKRNTECQDSIWNLEAP